MPTLPILDDQTRMLQANRRAIQAQLKQEQDAAQRKREFWFKLKFSTCLVAGVFIVSFLIAAYGLR